MRSLLLIAAVLVAGALALEAGQQCAPGSTFKLDCNTCRCSVDGKVMSCTRKFCVPEEQGDDPKVQSAAAEEVSNGQQDLAAEKEEEHVHTNGQVCTPNEVKMEDCNRCKCAANGIGWFCTRRSCPPREKRSTDAVQPAFQCTPGSSFKSADGCNDCVCGPSGIAACTMKFCFSNTKTKRDVAQQPPQNKCVPGSSFKSADGCNDCFCTDNGIAACTMKFCFFNQPAPKSKREAMLPEKQCEPGINFKHADGCNDCFCTETGVAACTAKLCFMNPRTKRQVAKADKQCVSGTSFKSADGCNDCFCGDNGIAACTMKFCFFDEPVVNRQKRDASDNEENCVPGTQFLDKDGCNTCFCTETGHAACTEKLCLTNPRTRRSADNEELPISEVAPGAPGFTCNPGKSFKYQCNNCRCDTDGQSAACTFKFCLPGEY
ncbi:laminin subunit alpha-5-like [Ochlerotatus camptorhynchus]|uniref:laminin subunit alpha-5-like n=1 Tax=Ochlerotatus camptorhynchus TaxID=644619 RepID=UPI0031D0079E